MKDLFIYKQRFFTCMLILGYAYLHSALCASFSIATGEQLMLGQAPLPFAQRMLIPWLLQKIHTLTSIKISDLLFLCELLFTALFYFALNALLRTEFEVKKATLLSWLFFLLLPLITLINYRLTIGGTSPIFYLYDTPTLFFLAAGYLCCLRQQWLFFYLLVFLATLNRESSILLVLLIPALYWGDKKPKALPLVISSLLFVTAKAIVLMTTAKLPGTIMAFYKLNTPYTLFYFNLQWLFQHENILLFLFCIAGLPFLWFTFYDYIPLKYRPLRYVLLMYFVGLLCIGVFPETRIFSEIALLLYLPVCVAMHHWLTDKPALVEKTGIGYFINRYAVIGLLVLIVLLQNQLNQLVIAIVGN